jgi:hypothetical protein
MENVNVSAEAIERLEPSENHEDNGNSRRNEVKGCYFHVAAVEQHEPENSHEDSVNSTGKEVNKQGILNEDYPIADQDDSTGDLAKQLPASLQLEPSDSPREGVEASVKGIDQATILSVIEPIVDQDDTTSTSIEIDERSWAQLYLEHGDSHEEQTTPGGKGATTSGGLVGMLLERKAELADIDVDAVNKVRVLISSHYKLVSS